MTPIKHWIPATCLASALVLAVPVATLAAGDDHAEVAHDTAHDPQASETAATHAEEHGEESLPHLPAVTREDGGALHFEAPASEAAAHGATSHSADDAHTPSAAAPVPAAAHDVHDTAPAPRQAQPPQLVMPGTGASDTPQAAPFDLPPEERHDAYYKPDWKRYEKSGLFGRQPAELTRDETPDIFATEKHYLALLNSPLPPEQRRETLLEMAEMYQRYNIKPKLAATYERFIEVFPQDPIVPELYIRLGFVYREIGAFKMALTKFYAVLNASLSIDRSSMEAYRLLSLKAQLEIADTYYLMGDYEEAAKFFLRLKRLDLSLDDRALVDFKYAYSQYLLKAYPTVITSMEAFIKAYPKHPLVPEGHFLLANSFKELGQQRNALAEVLSLLQYQESRQEDSGTWIYWKKRTGNQLANEFYEQGDFASALKIYQAMAILSDTPEWQWPVIYQIGLCYERLRMIPKSIEAYELIDIGVKKLEGDGGSMPPGLSELYQQSQWRLEHLRWIGKTEVELNELIGQGS